MREDMCGRLTNLSFDAEREKKRKGSRLAACAMAHATLITSHLCHVG